MELIRITVGRLYMSMYVCVQYTIAMWIHMNLFQTITAIEEEALLHPFYLTHSISQFEAFRCNKTAIPTQRREKMAKNEEKMTTKLNGHLQLMKTHLLFWLNTEPVSSCKRLPYGGKRKNSFSLKWSIQ